MVLTAIIYLATIGLCTFLAGYASQKKDERVVFLVILIASSVAGFRSVSVGNDTAGYYMMFESNGTWGAVREEAFYVYIRLMMFLFGKPHICLFVTSLITNTFLVFGFWKMRPYCSFPRMILAYMVIPYFLIFSGVRQWLSLSIIMFVIPDLLEEKYIKYVCYVIAASLFHYSSAVALIFVFIMMSITARDRRKKRDFFFRVGWAVLAITFVFAVIPMYQAEYSSLINDIARENRGGILMSIFRFCIAALYAVHIRNIKVRYRVCGNHDRRFIYALTFFEWGFLLWAACAILGQFFQTLARIGWIFLLCQGLVYGSCSKERSQMGKFTQIALDVIFVYSLYSMFAVDGNQMVPYTPFWVD